MALKGEFGMFFPNRFLGHIKVWQFVLKNTNMVFSETFDFMLCDCYGQQPFFFRGVKLKPGQSLAFNYDTVDWAWCQDDYAAIIDANNRVLKKWIFHIREYAPGECPECHGTKKCKSCRGQGWVYPPGHIERGERCQRCGGGGKCITCDITYRKPKPGLGPTGLRPF